MGGGPGVELAGISIHGPRVGADQPDAAQYGEVEGFQSTAPVWGPTYDLGTAYRQALISIHGPRVGADGDVVMPFASVPIFQSTAPVWGPTRD